MSKVKFKIQSKHFVFYSGVSFLIIFLVTFSVLFSLEKQRRNLKLEDTKSFELSSITLAENLMGGEFYATVADLNYLAGFYMDEWNETDSRENIEHNWAQFSDKQGIYDQIRFIDAEGNEIIRINFVNGEAVLVEQQYLQNKKDRYYFYETAKLPEGSVYVSPLDLNVENGKVEVPFKPMVRFGAPVYAESGELLGVIVLNYLAEIMLDNFRALAGHSNGDMILLNDEGYWLSSPDNAQEWNFMFESTIGETFAQDYPEEWAEILAGRGQILTENGLFTFSTVDLSSKVSSEKLVGMHAESIHMGGGNWHIVSSVLREGEYETYFTDDFFLLIKSILKDNILFFSIILFVSILTGFMAFLYKKSYEKTKYYSKYDALTNVFNRNTGTEKLDEILMAKDRKNFKISICFIDVNGLKEVNDILGHEMGDELLTTVSDIIKDQIRENDFMARMGGDEFLLVFSRIGEDEAEAVWKRITSEFERINAEEDRNYMISVSHGIVSCSGDGTCATTDRMIKAADEKMYEEKRVIKQSFYAIRKEPS